MIAQICRARFGSVVVIGSGEVGRLTSDMLSQVGVRVASIGDNDPQQWGRDWDGLRVDSVPGSLGRPADAVVIASVAHEPELRRQVRAVLAQRQERRRIFSPTR